MGDYTQTAITLHHNKIVAIPFSKEKAPLSKFGKLHYGSDSYRKIITRFYGDPHGMAIVAGKASNNIEAIDIGLKEDGTDLYPTALKIIRSSPILRDVAFLIVQTPSGGHHLIYRCADVGPSQKLATIGRKVVISTIGEKGCIITVPTPDYQLLKGGPIPEITSRQRYMLFSILRAWNKPDFSDVLERIF